MAGVSRDLALKIYWPEEERPDEAKTISQAIAKRADPDIYNHLPTVYATQDFACRTGAVREALQVQNEAGSQSRVLRVTVFTFLVPITSLSKHEFIRAWLDCVRCECYKTWLMCI